MVSSNATNPKDLLLGGVLQCIEAITTGMPFEVWKTHMGTYRKETTMEAFRNIYRKNGAASFWKGWQPKMVESFLKGGVLLFSKDAIIRALKNVGCGDVTAGLFGGFGGGVSQVVVLGPCTFLVTASTIGDGKTSIMQQITTTFKSHGIRGFYRGGVALMLRQGSNWASRQGLTDVSREILKSRHTGDPRNIKLSVGEEALAGIIGRSAFRNFLLGCTDNVIQVGRCQLGINPSKF